MAVITNNTMEDLHAKPEPFCSFCLRERPANVEFYKNVIGCSQEMRTALQSMLGYDFNLTNFAICKPCWKVMQLVQDFRLRCFEANEVVQRVSKGLNNVGDGWFSAKNLATIESVRMTVRDQMQHIGKINVARRALVLDDSAEEGEKDKDAVEEQPEATVDEGEHLESEITVGETKVESSHEEVGVPNLATHKCNICNESFRSEESLSNHFERHPVNASVKCKMFCDLRFNTVEDRARHSRFCTEIPQTCTVCGKRQRNKTMLRIHYQQEHSDEVSYECENCGKRFRRLETLRAHKEHSHTGNAYIYPCEVCGRMFASKSGVRMHVQKMHPARNCLEE